VQSFRDLIARWPTIAAFAREVGVRYEAAQKMKNWNSVDQAHWAAVIEAAKIRGIAISPQVLVEMSARRKRKLKKSAQNEGRAVA